VYLCPPLILSSSMRAISSSQNFFFIVSETLAVLTSLRNETKIQTTYL
jgi:hypothetical protein